MSGSPDARVVYSAVQRKAKVTVRLSLMMLLALRISSIKGELFKET